MKEKGITILELVMVLLIMGILAGAALPVVHRLGMWPLKTTAREIATAMREARQTAITHGVTCTLVFYEISGRYRLDLPDGTRWYSVKEGVSFAANNFPIVGERPTLYFRYTGAPNRGGHVAVRDQDGSWLYIIVTPVTGRVRIDSRPP